MDNIKANEFLDLQFGQKRRNKVFVAVEEADNKVFVHNPSTFSLCFNLVKLFYLLLAEWFLVRLIILRLRFGPFCWHSKKVDVRYKKTDY